MEKLVLCGKIRTESPDDNDLCSGQSAFDFLGCAINRNNNNNKNNKGKVNDDGEDVHENCYACDDDGDACPVHKITKNNNITNNNNNNNEYDFINNDRSIHDNDNNNNNNNNNSKNNNNNNNKNRNAIKNNPSHQTKRNKNPAKTSDNIYDTIGDVRNSKNQTFKKTSPPPPSSSPSSPNKPVRPKTRDDYNCLSGWFDDDDDEDGDDNDGVENNHGDEVNFRSIPCYYNKNCREDDDDDGDRTAGSATKSTCTPKRNRKSVIRPNPRHDDDNNDVNGIATVVNSNNNANDNVNNSNSHNDGYNGGIRCSTMPRSSSKIQQQLDIGRGDEKICYLTDLTERFNVIRKIGNGTFGSVFLALRLRDQKKVALKKLAKDKTKIEDFCIEFRYGRLFSKHPGVLETSATAYVTNSWYVLVQEYAPMSDLLRLVPPRVGLPEVSVKSVMRQLVGAVQYVHEAGVVHRDLKLENILVFQNQSDDQNLTRVKLGDFGVARKVGTKVCKVCEGTTYTPPEICSLARHSHYKVLKSADVWSTGVLVFCLMTGSFPWQQADLNRDPLFQSFARWQCKKTTVVPEHWTRFSASLHKLFHRFLDPRPEKRPEVACLSRYLGSRWSCVPGSSISGSSQDVTGSESTLACASSQPPSSFTSIESIQCHPSHHVLHPSSSTNVKQMLGDSTNEPADDTFRACNCYNPKNKSAFTHYELYKNAPFKTSGALHSPIFDDDVFCNIHGSEETKANKCQVRSVSLRRCHHHHQNLLYLDDEGEEQRYNNERQAVRDGKKSVHRRSRKLKSNDVSNSNVAPSGASQEPDPEAVLRLDRVNRWLMMSHT